MSSASLTQWFQTLEDLSKQSLAKQLFELVGQKINAQLDTRCSRKRPSHPMREPTRRKSLSSSNTSSSQWRFTSRSPIHRSRPFSRSDWFHPLTTMSIDPSRADVGHKSTNGWPRWCKTPANSKTVASSNNCPSAMWSPVSDESSSRDILHPADRFV